MISAARARKAGCIIVCSCTLVSCTVASPAEEQSAVSSASSMRYEDVHVTIDHYRYSQKELTIRAGTTVVWTNKDKVVHTVTGDRDVTPNSGTIQVGESFSYTFTEPGEYPYHCAIYPTLKNLKAVVIVTP